MAFLHTYIHTQHHINTLSEQFVNSAYEIAFWETLGQLQYSDNIRSVLVTYDLRDNELQLQ